MTDSYTNTKTQGNKKDTESTSKKWKNCVATPSMRIEWEFTGSKERNDLIFSWMKTLSRTFEVEDELIEYLKSS